jgi:hypothetical protein
LYFPISGDPYQGPHALNYQAPILPCMPCFTSLSVGLS